MKTISREINSYRAQFFVKLKTFLLLGGGDLYAGASGGGHYCENGVDIEIALLGILAAFAVSFAVLYMASTTNTGRKKRELSISDQIGDVLWKGKDF